METKKINPREIIQLQKALQRKLDCKDEDIYFYDFLEKLYSKLYPNPDNRKDYEKLIIFYEKLNNLPNLPTFELGENYIDKVADLILQNSQFPTISVAVTAFSYFS